MYGEYHLNLTYFIRFLAIFWCFQTTHSSLSNSVQNFRLIHWNKCPHIHPNFQSSYYKINVYRITNPYNQTHDYISLNLHFFLEPEVSSLNCKIANFKSTLKLVFNGVYLIISTNTILVTSLIHYVLNITQKVQMLENYAIFESNQKLLLT